MSWEFKANFCEFLKMVIAGEEIGICLDKKNEIIGKLVPEPRRPKGPRKIGILESKGKVVFAKDFSITENEFLGISNFGPQ